jgi:2-methylcitrate dehydratase PrpD
MAGALDKFIQIINENSLQPEDIQKVSLRVWPVTNLGFARENQLRTEQDFHFKPPYAVACAVHRIPPARWLDRKVRQDPKIRDFMQKVEFDIACDEEEFAQARIKDPSAALMSAEVVARGKTFRRQTLHAKGSWQPEEFKNTDEELIKKFRGNVSRVLRSDKANKVVDTVFRLEKLENAAKLMKMLSP